MGATTTKGKRVPLYKQGDFVTAPNKVFLEIMAVIDDGVLPIYGTISPKAWDKVIWRTEFELTDEAYVKGTPDFEQFASIRAGDIMKMGWTDDAEYIRVLARVGDVVLLSAAPQSKKVKEVTELSKQLEDLTDGMVKPLEMMPAEDREMLKKMASTTHASKIATEWETVTKLALMNWQLLSEG